VCVCVCGVWCVVCVYVCVCGVYVWCVWCVYVCVCVSEFLCHFVTANKMSHLSGARSHFVICRTSPAKAVV
jgi:hypothetical protein